MKNGAKRVSQLPLRWTSLVFILSFVFFNALRASPVMAVGQAAGTAAAMAAIAGAPVNVRNVPVAQLRRRLVEAGAVL